MASTEKTHTPGEWKREGLTIYALDESGTNNRFYTQVQGGWSWRSLNRDGGGTRTSPEELEADARLIAAAPDMLAALEAAEELYQTGLIAASNELIESVVSLRRAAIAKATQP